MAIYQSRNARRLSPLRAMVFGFTVITVGALCALAGFYKTTLG